jgi:hypothetical protein
MDTRLGTAERERRRPTAPDRAKDATVAARITSQRSGDALLLFRDVPAKSTEGGVVHSTPALMCGGIGVIFDGCVVPSHTMSTISVRTTGTCPNLERENCYRVNVLTLFGTVVGD